MLRFGPYRFPQQARPIPVTQQLRVGVGRDDQLRCEVLASRKSPRSGYAVRESRRFLAIVGHNKIPEKSQFAASVTRNVAFRQQYLKMMHLPTLLTDQLIVSASGVVHFIAGRAGTGDAFAEVTRL